VNILIILELLAFVLVVTVIVHEIIVPVLQGRIVFPMFRPEARLRERLRALNQRELEAQLEAEVRRKEKRQAWDKKASEEHGDGKD
jgi:predicted Holliday junction resolvase-like endonuclease